jgi:hypothetical protein
MKKFLLLPLLFFSCQKDADLQYLGQEIIDGKVSASENGHSGRFSTYPKIWVQNATNTKEVEIPFQYEGRWKVGDSCLLIIKKYKEVQNGK